MSVILGESNDRFQNVVPVTEFILPNGRQVRKVVNVSNKSAEQAGVLLGVGYVFELERLRTGELSFEVIAEKEDDEGDRSVIASCLVDECDDIFDPFAKLIHDALERLDTCEKARRLLKK